MRKVNYKSDFDIVLNLTDCRGKKVSFPECDWEALFWTSIKAKAFVASCKGGVFYNCRKYGDGVRFVFDGHGLGPGKLQWEFHAAVPNDIYPDGFQDLYTPQSLDVELVTGASDCTTDAEAEVIAPYIKGDQGDKGDPLTYADLTEADKADLAPLVAEDTDAEADDILPGVVQSAVRFTGQALTPGERAQALRNLGEPEKQLLRAMWKRACTSVHYPDGGCIGGWDEQRGYWLGSTDHLTEDEVIDIMQAMPSVRENYNKVYMADCIGQRRAFLPPTIDNVFVPCICMFFEQASAKEIRLSQYSGRWRVSNGNQMFYNCSSLVAIPDVIEIARGANVSYMFRGCSMLEQVRLVLWGGELSMQWSPNLSLESLQYIVKNALNTSAITITLHPSAFARLTDELVEAAQAKNIAFVTP